MRRMRTSSALAALALCLLASAASATLQVVATIHPLADLLSQLGGAEVSVTTLLPAGANPHSYEPAPTQMLALSQSALLVRIGAGLDNWANKLLDAGAGQVAVVTVTDGMKLAALDDAEEAAEHGGDPHVWLDPILMRDNVLPAILGGLSAVAPAKRDLFEENARRVASKLTALDSDLQRILAPVKGRSFVAFHSAWGYFSRRYELHEVGSLEPFPGKEVSARQIMALIDASRMASTHAVLVEPSFSPRVAEQIAREIGGQTYVVDPLGVTGLAGRDAYDDLMHYNARTFREALQ
ncbi:MAG TPA: metal ABC transporter substrate-binding protein [Candidatus Acidoferrales bacterium]|nr:metal ABC transporter substrate-binding protein [Candidatus Acidoferrales bacterium]